MSAPNRASGPARSDDALIRGVIKGDDSAFAEFSVRSLPTLLRYLSATCRQLGIPEHFAEDAVQEAFGRAIEWVKGDPEREASLGWIVRVGQNVLRDIARRGRRAVPTDDLRLHEAPPDLITEVDEELWRAMARLPSDERTLLEMVVIEGVPFPTVAEYFGISLVAVYKRHQRALARLRELMS